MVSISTSFGCFPSTTFFMRPGSSILFISYLNTLEALDTTGYTPFVYSSNLVE